MHGKQAAHFSHANALVAHQPGEQYTCGLPLKERVYRADRRDDRHAIGQALVNGRQQRCSVAAEGNAGDTDMLDTAFL
ncbi:hypothetical protein D3C80_876310 [compost metagenome]